MSVEDKLNQLKTIIESLPYVQRGDYISSDHHNKIVDALKLIQEIIEEVKDTASLYIPINAPHDPFKFAVVFNKYLNDNYSKTIPDLETRYYIDKPRSSLFSKSRTIIRPSSVDDFKYYIDKAIGSFSFSVSSYRYVTYDPIPTILLLAAFKITNDDLETVKNILDYAYTSIGDTNPLFYAFGTSITHQYNYYFDFAVSIPIDKNKNIVFKVTDRNTNTSTTFSIYSEEWYFVAIYSDLSAPFAIATLFDEHLNALKAVELTALTTTETYADIMVNVEDIIVNKTLKSFAAYGVGVDYILVKY